MIDQAFIEKNIAEEEGKVLRAYLDTKKILTVGIGWNCRAHDTTPIIGRKIAHIGDRITDAECSKLFQVSLSNTISIMKKKAQFFDRSRRGSR